MKNLSPRGYEDFVERVLLEMDIWSGAKIYRNKRFPGVRQAGNYEVDIALHLQLTELVSFVLIVECKHHSRPVTRPVVQQLAQTRDAISAQKGAVVSPVGFSAEAVDVAKDLGIALWVIGKDIPTEVVMSFDGPRIMALSELFLRLRVSYLGIFSLVPSQAPHDDLQMINYVATKKIELLKGGSNISSDQVSGYPQFGREVRTGSEFFSYQYDRLFDHECAANQITKWVLEECSDKLLSNALVLQNLEKWRKAVCQFAQKNNYDASFMKYIEQDDWAGFYSCFDGIPREHWEPFAVGRPIWK